MQMRFAALLAAFVTAAAGAAGAQSSYVWEELASADGQTVSYNPLTVARANGTVNFLSKHTFSPAQPFPGGQTVSYYTVHITLDCAASTFSHSSFTAYDAAGNVLPGVVDPTPAGMNPITPGGFSGEFETKFCT